VRGAVAWLLLLAMTGCEIQAASCGVVSMRAFGRQQLAKTLPAPSCYIIPPPPQTAAE
jgi:hypothetical protein